MSVSATSAVRLPDPIESLHPTLPSENAQTARSSSTLSMFGEDSPSFWDLLDVINPLQHIPLVNDLYRDLTGDKIGVGARLTGGALFGGVIGLAGAAFNCIVEEASGATPGGHLIALVRGDSPTEHAGTALAQATPAPAPAPAPAAPATNATVPASPPPATAAAGTATPAASPPPGTARPISLGNLIDGAEPPPPAAMPQPPVVTTPAPTPAGVPVAQAAPSPTGTIAATAPASDRPMRSATGRDARVLAMPSRTTPIATRTPPQIEVPISNGGGRSNVPITGARPQTAMIAPATASPMVAAQAAPASPPPTGEDWFVTAMSQGLEKYQRAGGHAAAGSP